MTAPRAGYCVKADLLGSIQAQGLAELAGNGVSVDDPTLNQAIADLADAIDLVLAGRGYVVPIADPVTVAGLRVLSIDLLKFNLFGLQDTNPMGESPTRKNWEKAQKRLEDIAAGRQNLPPSAETVQTSDTTVGDPEDSFGSDDPVFDLSAERGGW